MTEFCEQDLTGARFERVNLRDATFTQVYLNDARLREVDFTGTQVRAALFSRCRMRGVELVDVDIYGELQNVVVNGVDIAPLVDAELNRRMPERAKMRPDDSAGFHDAWAILERLWEGTLTRARTFPEEALHRSVDGEWSFIQTLRHLNFASACWVDRMILGDVSPWLPLDLPWDEAPPWDGFRWEREAQPSLDEVLALRRERQATVHNVMTTLTDEQLLSRVTRSEPGWPQEEDFPLKECLRIVLNEEWEHRLYAERDLTALKRELIMDILLIAGLWLDGSAWDDVVPPLEALGHRPVPLTLPGQGDGAASATLDDQVAAVVAAVDSASDKPMVVGHSAACALAWLGADARPERIAKVALIGGWPSLDGELYADFFETKDGVMPFPGWGPFEGADSADLDEEAQRSIASAAIPVPEGVSKGVVRLADERRYDVPVILVCPEFSPAEAQEWIDAGDLPELAKAKHLDFVDIDSGHWPMFSKPVELAQLLGAAAADG